MPKLVIEPRKETFKLRTRRDRSEKENEAERAKVELLTPRTRNGSQNEQKKQELVWEI